MPATPSFPPAPEEACFCGSGVSFRGCCGSTAVDRPPPCGIVLMDDGIEEQLRGRLLQESASREGKRFRGVTSAADPEGSGSGSDPDESAFYERVPMATLQPELNTFVSKSFTQLAAQHYGVQLDWCEEPKLLRYRPGGQFAAHADGAELDRETKVWRKSKDRDLSFLAYLDDGFTGGSLTFTYFNYSIVPRPGLLVVFPSDIRYTHAAEQVHSGVRHAIVSWASVWGVPKLYPEPPERAIPCH